MLGLALALVPVLLGHCPSFVCALVVDRAWIVPCDAPARVVLSGLERARPRSHGGPCARRPPTAAWRWRSAREWRCRGEAGRCCSRRREIDDNGNDDDDDEGEGDDDAGDDDDDEGDGEADGDDGCMT